ncbi:M56 family metallopeptidase [Kitasatospora sp. NBC_01287]|uniref:M56 family metallopeptidase n=1 Tax=Kitasatospora sp. NBC_01287 TaxID=2903573 RepID=UPI0022522EBE|nr:M56 family metallopeptidase [Kitasatospora sp. NBC_01287]MCX4746201.1 M56 family metallopeptidase [Kitasatospora sp. NBC_01287]
MILLVLAPLLIPFLAAPAARRLADALPPRPAAWVLGTTGVLLAGASAASLGLLAAGGLLRIPAVAALGHISLPWLAQASPAALVAAWPAALALVLAGLLTLRTAHRQVTDLRRAHAALAPCPASDASTRTGSSARTAASATSAISAVSATSATDGPPLAVLDDDRADAYALPGRPGRPGRIVVTAGMLRALPAPERAALLAHERAHLTARHHLFLAAAEYAAVLHPALGRLRAPLGFHLERWADECAARAVGDRALTARAVGHAALAAARTPRPPRPGLAPAAATGPVPRRVAALLSPQPHTATRTGTRRRVVAALALAACLGVSTAATAATSDLHRTVESAQLADGGR